MRLVFMPLKVNVKYWDNRNYGFGHIAVEVMDSQDNNKKHYISWAMTNDSKLDLKKHGKLPIDIALPEVNRSFEDFEKLFKDSIYYLSPESLDYLEYVRYGEGSTDPLKAKEKSQDLSSEARRQLSSYWSRYNIATKSCAHCVLDILAFAGYNIPQQSKSNFGLRPYTVAKLVCKIAETELNEEINNLFLNDDINNDQKINLSISHTIELLEFKKTQKLSDHFTTSLSNIEKDIATLKTIGTYQSTDINSAKNLINAIDSLTSSIAIEETKNCINLMTENNLLEARTLVALDSLHSATRKLSDAFINTPNINSKHIEKITDITDSLSLCLHNYLNSMCTKEAFENRLSKLFKEIKPLLSRYEICHDSLNKLKKVIPQAQKYDIPSLFFKRSNSTEVAKSSSNYNSTNNYSSHNNYNSELDDDQSSSSLPRSESNLSNITIS